jgi:hypothetical protein
MKRHFLGQTRMQSPQVTQAKLSIRQDFGSLPTTMALAGQRFEQAPQWMQAG